MSTVVVGGVGMVKFAAPGKGFEEMTPGAIGSKWKDREDPLGRAVAPGEAAAARRRAR